MLFVFIGKIAGYEKKREKKLALESSIEQPSEE
jgi:hypothetical protein